MKLLALLATVAAFFGLASAANASPITYDFSAVLATSVNGSTTVTGTFTADTALGPSLSNIITDWSFTTPIGIIDKTNTVAFGSASGTAQGPVSLSLGTASGALFLVFETTAAAFDGTKFTVDAIPFGPQANAQSELSTNGGSLHVTFTSATVTPAPEPASVLLFGSGFGAAIMRLRKRKA